MSAASELRELAAEYRQDAGTKRRWLEDADGTGATLSDVERAVTRREGEMLDELADDLENRADGLEAPA